MANACAGIRGRRARVVSTNRSNLVSVVKVWTVDGRTVKVDGVGNWGEPARAASVRQAVDLINRYARGADPGPAERHGRSLE